MLNEGLCNIHNNQTSKICYSLYGKIYKLNDGLCNIHNNQNSKRKISFSLYGRIYTLNNGFLVTMICLHTKDSTLIKVHLLHTTTNLIITTYISI